MSRASIATNVGDYEARVRDFTWERAAAELGLPARSANLGWLLSDRICEEGGAGRRALTMRSVGEPLNPEAVTWGREAFGLPFHDSFWQTETGSIVISNFPGMPVKPGSMGRPFPGIWPAMFRAYWRNEVQYASKFENGWYVTGDRARIDDDGYFWFVGRDDDVINTGGHLVGPFEIESALLEHEAIAESAAIGAPDPVNMEVVKVFVVLKPGHEPSDELELSIMNTIRKRLSPLAMPQIIEFTDSLPRTRSGKIMRRLLKAQDWGEPVGDLSTLEDD